MAERLKNTLSFNLAPGASVVLPHGLVTSLGRPLAPDIIFVPNPSLDVVATTTTSVTLMNTGPLPVADALLVEAWHTIERAFSDVNDEDLPIKPYIVFGGDAAPYPLGAFVYRPGATGVNAPGGNVFTNWALLCAALDATRKLGKRTLQFDSTFMEPAPIPAGVWNMTDVSWTSYNRRGLTRVEFLDGASIVLDPLSGVDDVLGLNIEANGMVFYYNGEGDTPPFDGVDILCNGNNVRFANTNPNAKPMIRVQEFNLLLFSGECVNGGLVNYPDPELAAPVIDANGGGYFIFGGGGFIGNNFATDLSVGGGGAVFAATQQGFSGDPAEGWFDQWHAPDLEAAGGFVAFDDNRAAVRFRFNPTFSRDFGTPVTPDLSPYAAAYCEFVPVDTNEGEVTVNLPSAERSIGEQVVIKDVGGNAGDENSHIIVASTYGDTVEDGLIDTNSGFGTWVCWGSGIWSRI